MVMMLMMINIINNNNDNVTMAFIRTFFTWVADWSYWVLLWESFASSHPTSRQTWSREVTATTSLAIQTHALYNRN
eukprot:1576553-Amphidinium_carterae.1